MRGIALAILAIGTLISVQRDTEATAKIDKIAVHISALLFGVSLFCIALGI